VVQPCAERLSDSTAHQFQMCATGPRGATQKRFFCAMAARCQDSRCGKGCCALGASLGPQEIMKGMAKIDNAGAPAAVTRSIHKADIPRRKSDAGDCPAQNVCSALAGFRAVSLIILCLEPGSPPRLWSTVSSSSALCAQSSKATVSLAG